MNVLIIVDMQEASFHNADKFDAPNVIKRINTLSEHVRSSGGKVIFIQHDGTEQEGLSPNTSGWEILSSLTHLDSDLVVRKTTNDSFHNTNLQDELAQLCPEQLIFAGWATDFCVDTTIRSAVSHNYNVVVAADCHTVSDRPHMSAELVITHHNWVWGNLLTSGKEVQVKPLLELCGSI